METCEAMNTFHADVARYRECTRHLRNEHFLASDGTPAAWDIVEQWQELDELLFKFLVLRPHELEPAGMDQPHPHIFLAIRGGGGASVHINRDKHATSGYWDHPTNTIVPGEVEMQFVGFFDFDKMRSIDFHYVMVHLFNAVDADLNGRTALIEWQSVEFKKCK